MDGDELAQHQLVVEGGSAVGDHRLVVFVERERHRLDRAGADRHPAKRVPTPVIGVSQHRQPASLRLVAVGNDRESRRGDDEREMRCVPGAQALAEHLPRGTGIPHHHEAAIRPIVNRYTVDAGPVIIRERDDRPVLRINGERNEAHRVLADPHAADALPRRAVPSEHGHAGIQPREAVKVHADVSVRDVPLASIGDGNLHVHHARVGHTI